MTLDIMPVYGTRPEAIKMAPLITKMASTVYMTCTPVVTGQHRVMLDQVNDAFGIRPEVDLDIFEHGMSLSRVTEKTLSRLSPVLKARRPDAVLVQGDTTSALAAGLAAFYERIPVIHLEAGLRTPSLDSPFPEEGNRRLLTQITRLHLAPTSGSKQNLLRSGVLDSDIAVTGNTVIDALLTTVDSEEATRSPLLERLRDDPRRCILVTSHRRDSWGEPMRRIARALARLAAARSDTVFVFPLHANPAVREIFEPLLMPFENIILTDSLDYADLCLVLARCSLVVTDSGGIQEEAPALGKPVVVLRDSTERPEAVEAGTAMLVGTDTDRIVAAVDRLLDNVGAYEAMAHARNPFGDGHAAERSIAAISALFGIGSRLPDFEGEKEDGPGSDQ